MAKVLIKERRKIKEIGFEKKSLFKCKTVDNKLGVLNLTVAVSSPVPRVVQLQVPFTDKPTLWFATF